MERLWLRKVNEGQVLIRHGGKTAQGSPFQNRGNCLKQCSTMGRLGTLELRGHELHPEVQS